MKRIILSIAFIAIGTVFGFSLARGQNDGKPATSSAADEQAIRSIAQAFKQAFDKHDAEAIAAVDRASSA